MYVRLARPFPSPDTSHGFAFHLGGFEAHDESGGAFLEALGFDGAVGFLTAQHVAAKRYLVAVDPRYAAKLSRASRTTLGFQGGPMSVAEVARCEADPPGHRRTTAGLDEAARNPPLRGWGAARVVEEFEEESGPPWPVRLPLLLLLLLLLLLPLATRTTIISNTIINAALVLGRGRRPSRFPTCRAPSSCESGAATAAAVRGALPEEGAPSRRRGGRSGGGGGSSSTSRLPQPMRPTSRSSSSSSSSSSRRRRTTTTTTTRRRRRSDCEEHGDLAGGPPRGAAWCGPRPPGRLEPQPPPRARARN